MTEYNEHPRPTRETAITRQQLLQGGATGLGLLAVGGLAGACGGGSSSSVSSAATTGAGSIHKGGTATVAFVGNGTSETVNPGQFVAIIDGARCQALYDPFVAFQPDQSLGYVLAEHLEPNSDATVWTMKVRSGVTFHNGKPLTAKDAMYTLNYDGQPTSTVGLASQYVDLPKMKLLDPLTLQIPLKTPNSDWPNFLQQVFVIQDGETDFKHPIGTGPFKFVSFTPGQQSVFTRNPHYWQEGKPYLDELKFISVPDQTARLNALLSGQAQAMEALTFTQAKQYANSSQIKPLTANGSNYVPMYMATTLAPFNDVRVRQAIRLIADRPQLIEQVQLGFGHVGNDLFGQGHPEYDDSIPQRAQDIEKAKSLLKAAGMSDLNVTLYSSTVATGMLESATVFADQAKQAGVTIQVQNVPGSEYFGADYLKQNFAQSLWFAYDSVFSQMARSVAPGAPFNETHWNDPKWSSIYRQALATVDTAKRQDLANELQQILWDQGGYVWWGNFPLIDGLAPSLHGVVPNSGGPLGDGDFQSWWLSG